MAYESWIVAIIELPAPLKKWNSGCMEFRLRGWAFGPNRSMQIMAGSRPFRATVFNKLATMAPKAAHVSIAP